jgi:hypothetical protein
VVEICTHHVREVSRWPELALDLNNGLTLCWACHFYEAHNGHPNWVHGRYATSRRPLPGQLELFARWPGPLFALSRPAGGTYSPPAGSIWPGPQRLLFPLKAGLYSGVR